MHEKSVRTVLFVALLLVAPAILFMVQVVFVIPPVLLLAGLVYMLKKTLLSGVGMENLTFLAFFLVHLLIFSGGYWLVALLLGKLACLVRQGTPRILLLTALLAGLAAVTQLPIYGGGGHGPARMGPLQHLLAGLEQSYGQGSMLTVYLTAAGLVAAATIWRLWRKNLHRAGTERVKPV